MHGKERVKMRIAIVGSRGFNNYQLLKASLEEYINEATLVASGGAKGADSLGEYWAKANGIETKIFLPDWNKHGKSAGYKRNIDIIENADLVIAFWDGISAGTKHSMDIAEKTGKKLVTITF